MLPGTDAYRWDLQNFEHMSTWRTSAPGSAVSCWWQGFVPQSCSADLDRTDQNTQKKNHGLCRQMLTSCISKCTTVYGAAGMLRAQAPTSACACTPWLSAAGSLTTPSQRTTHW
jgi:hypothetical protein